MRNSTAKLIVWVIVAAMVVSIGTMMFVRPDLLKGIEIKTNLSGLHYSNADRYRTGDCEVEGVKRLDVSWLDDSVSIEAYDGDKVRLTEDARTGLSEEQKLHWYNDNGTLRVHYAASGIQSGEALNLGKKLTVMIPRGMRLEKIEVVNISGEIRAQEIAAGKMVIETVSGNVELRDCKTETLEVDTVSGEGQFVFGKEVPKEAEIDSVSGNMTFVMPEGSGVEAELDAVSGRIEGDGWDIERRTKKQVRYGDGGFRIEMDAVSGDLIIRKAD